MLFNTTRHVLPRYFCTFYTRHNFSDESYQNFTASKIFNKGWHAALYIVQFPYPNDPISQLYNNWKPNLKCTKCCIVCTHYYSVYVYCIVLYTDHCEMITKLCYLESRFFNTSWGLDLTEVFGPYEVFKKPCSELSFYTADIHFLKKINFLWLS